MEDAIEGKSFPVANEYDHVFYLADPINPRADVDNIADKPLDRDLAAIEARPPLRTAHMPEPGQVRVSRAAFQIAVCHRDEAGSAVIGADVEQHHRHPPTL